MSKVESLGWFARGGIVGSFQSLLRLFLLLAFLLQPRGGLAQQAPTLGYLFPPAVQAGTSVDVRLGGYDLTDDQQFFIHDQRASLEILGPPGKFLVPPPPYWFGAKGRLTAFPIPREIPARLTVPADATPGPALWQTANANGGAATAVFLISRRKEIIESRWRDDPQALKELPIAVSGRVERIAEVDRYRFTATRDGPVTLDLMARRLGSDFHAALQVRTAAGELILDVVDTQGVDAVATFAASKGEQYVASLHDVDFRGNRAFVYRLSVTPGPRVVFTSPAKLRRGEQREVTLQGYGLKTGAGRWETVKQKVAAPDEGDRKSVAVAVKSPSGDATISIPLSDVAEYTEAEFAGKKPDDSWAVTGALKLNSPDDADRHSWRGKKGDVWRLSLESRAIGGALDVSLAILNAKDKQLATNDDLPGTPDAGLVFTAPEDGEFTCVVSNMASASDPHLAVYRLQAERLTPDFQLTAPQLANVALGGKLQLKVTAVRESGFKAPIKLRVEGLPQGVTAPEVEMPAGKNVANIAFAADKSMATIAQFVRIVGVAKVGDADLTRVARATVAGNRCPRRPGDNRSEHVLLTTTMKPPFSVELIDKNRQRSVHRGTTYPAPFVIKRNEGFAGEVLLRMAARQGRHRQGITAPILTVAADQGSALYPCFMPEWLETDRTTRMVVHGVAEVKDPSGKRRQLIAPANARITMILEGALMKVSSTSGEISVPAGKGFDASLEIARSAKLLVPVRIELAPPPEIRNLLHCQPLRLEPGEDAAVLRVTSDADSRLVGQWPLLVKATALRDGKWLVVSQAKLDVEFTAAGE